MNHNALVTKLKNLCHPIAELMPEKARLDEFVSAADAAGNLIETLLSEIGRLEAEVEELRDVPWPRWADEIAKKLQSYGVDVGPEDEWDLPNDLDEWLAGAVEWEARRAAANERQRIIVLVQSGYYIGSSLETMALVAAINGEIATVENALHNPPKPTIHSDNGDPSKLVGRG